MKLRNLALAVALAAPLSMQFALAQDSKTADQKKEVKDPVCGMTIDPAGAPKSAYKGKTYYFCSIEDKKEFDKAPASYIKLDKKDTTKK